MPDLIFAFTRRWKFIIGTSLLIAIIALIASLLSTKKYLSVATALPVNTALSDKGRIFNNNIEGLYSALGNTDDLDRIEGTAKLDTIFIAAVVENKLIAHYEIENTMEASHNAVAQLKSNSRISKTAYGELKIEVWDVDRNMAAAIANGLLQQLQNLHQHLHEENDRMVLAKLKAAYNPKIIGNVKDTVSNNLGNELVNANNDELKKYTQLINEYQLAVDASPKVLLTVEPARPRAKPDKPRTAQMVVFSFAAAFCCTFLLSLLLTAKENLRDHF